MLDLHVPKIIDYLTERSVLFLYPSSFPIHSNINFRRSFYGNIFLIFFLCLGIFSVNLIIFATYVKDAIWEIVLCSTCRKQSEYFDQRDVGKLLTCYIYNGAFCDNSLQLDPTKIYYHK